MMSKGPWGGRGAEFLESIILSYNLMMATTRAETCSC